MKVVVGLILMAAGILTAIYVGVWLMLVGGIVQGVGAIIAVPFDPVGLGLGLLRVFLAGVTGFASCCVLFLPGLALATD